MSNEYELLPSIPKRSLTARPLIIVQARMGSTRLPGKVMRPFHGVPILQLMLQRLSTLKGRASLMVATSTEERDRVIVELANRLRVDVFCGSETDVLDRFAKAAAPTSADTIVRITADCPLTDPVLIDRALDLFYSLHVEYMSNSIRRTYPQGFDTEIFTRDALEKAAKEATTPYEREHVTPYIITNPDRFPQACFVSKEDFSSWRLTVDTKEDYALIEKLAAELSLSFSFETVKKVLAIHPDWKLINT